MNNSMLFISIFIMAAVTFFTRAFPFLLFRPGQQIPAMIRYLGDVLPMAMMAMLVVYSLRNVAWFHAGGGIAEILALTLTAFVHHFRQNTLFSIASGTVFYMFLVQCVF